MFEGIIAASLLVLATIKLYDWIEYQLELRARNREGDHDG